MTHSTNLNQCIIGSQWVNNTCSMCVINLNWFHHHHRHRHHHHHRKTSCLQAYIDVFINGSWNFKTKHLLDSHILMRIHIPGKTISMLKWGKGVGRVHPVESLPSTPYINLMIHGTPEWWCAVTKMWSKHYVPTSLWRKYHYKYTRPCNVGPPMIERSNDKAITCMMFTMERFSVFICLYNGV